MMIFSPSSSSNGGDYSKVKAFSAPRGNGSTNLSHIELWLSAAHYEHVGEL